MPSGVHAKDQTAFRLDPELRARLKARAEEEGVTMTDYVSRAIENELARGITTDPALAVSPPRTRSRKPPANTAPPVQFRQPGNTKEPCLHRLPPGAWCKTCKTAKPEGGK